MPDDVPPSPAPGPQFSLGWSLSNGRRGELGYLPVEMARMDLALHPAAPGTRLSEGQVHLHSDVTFTSRQQVPQAFFMLSMQLAGSYRFRHPSLSEGVTNTESWRFVCMGANESETRYDHKTGVVNHVMMLVLPADRLNALLEGHRPPPLIQGFLDGSVDPSAGDVRMTATFRRILAQIRTNPYSGAMATLYVEAKIFEMLAEAFTEIAGQAESAHRTERRSRRAALIARDILMSDLGNPPSMEELARNTGLSLHRLNELFRDMFGATPFQCLTQWRLDQARLLLLQGGLSVKQVAHLMGYAHVSSFSHAYARRFGTPPTSDHRKR